MAVVRQYRHVLDLKIVLLAPSANLAAVSVYCLPRPLLLYCMRSLGRLYGPIYMGLHTLRPL